MELISSTKSFGGWVKRYKHSSSTVKGEMVFAIYLPPQAQTQTVPVLYWLSGLTCNDENFTQKAGAHRLAAELGMAIVCPDTSPRGSDYPAEHESYDFGSAAGFYLNATVEPYAQTYNMYDYVVQELPALIEANFPVNGLKSISGHSMGGHGALICALKNPGLYQSVSAFAPIVNPTQCPWGEKAFTGYLGEDPGDWCEYDATYLLGNIECHLPILIEQGLDDEFLQEQLKPENLWQVAEEKDVAVEYHAHKSYDHSYYFIATFIEKHMLFHARHLAD